MLKKIFYILLLIAIILSLVGTGMFFWYKNGGMQKYVLDSYGKKIIQSQTLYDLVRDGLGFSGERHTLILFLNNTELRPGGGFIGSYAVVSANNGIPKLLKVEGTEIIDNYSSSYLESVPPTVIKKYLGVEKWYFRDSNWSPDFVESAKKGLELYTKERGTSAADIDYVVGLTPTVIKEALKITGPVKVNGIEFTADNFVEKLQWEVEYGYAQQGISFDERKKTLQDLTKAVFLNLGKDFLKYNQDFMNLSKRMLKEKQIIIYSTDATIAKGLQSEGWNGEIKKEQGDFVLWADANLGALKTDLVMDRELVYTFFPTTSGKYLAKATMKYTHRGEFNWRTTRYRAYARVFVPEGSEFIKAVGAMNKEKSDEKPIIDWGIENGKQWFGTFIAIEPGKKGELTFEFYLSPKIIALIKENKYNLLIQKQIGTEAHKLTLNLDFGKNISKANPSEDENNYGDSKFVYNGDLRLDQSFQVELK